MLLHLLLPVDLLVDLFVKERFSYELDSLMKHDIGPQMKLDET
jgi:hypothetical protein